MDSILNASAQLNFRFSRELLRALCPPARMPWIPFTVKNRFYEDADFCGAASLSNKGTALFVRGLALQLRRALGLAIPDYLSERCVLYMLRIKKKIN
jgi:hypothetical protein